MAADGGNLSVIKRPFGSPMTGAGTHDGQFLAGGRDGGVFSVLTGALGDPAFSQTSLEFPEGMGSTPDVDYVAWDGEAFNMELDSSGFATWAARLNPDGSVKQPPTKYGLMLDSSYAGYDLGYKISTNATSGVTYLFAATFRRDITGHTRDGKRLPWIPAGGVLTLPLYSGPPYTDIGIDPDGGATVPTVSTDDQGGAWIAWNQSTNRRLANILGIQHIAIDGTLGTTTWFDKFSTVGHSLLARNSESALMILSSGNSLYACDLTGDKLSEPRLVTVEQPYGLAEMVDYREMQLLSDGNTDWLVMQQGTRNTVAVRVLKIAPGCVYPTHPTELLTL